MKNIKERVLESLVMALNWILKERVVIYAFVVLTFVICHSTRFQGVYSFYYWETPFFLFLFWINKRFLDWLAVEQERKKKLEQIKAKNDSDKNKFPVLSQRLTIKLLDGRITLKQADMDKAIIYLSNVEDYLQKKGITKW